MTFFTLTASDFAALATLRHVTPSVKLDREMTPILTAIKIIVTSSGWRAAATDRYVIAEIGGQFPADEEHELPEEELTVLLLDTDLVEIARRAKGALAGYGREYGRTLRFRVEILGDSVTVGTGYPPALGLWAQVSGNYPPVASLFIEDDPQPIDSLSVSPAAITALSKVRTPQETELKPSEQSELALRLDFNGTYDYSDAKLRAVSVYRAKGTGTPDSELFRGLFQPRLGQPR